MIRPSKRSDAPALAEIYNYYILETCSTFETDVIDGDEMWSRVQKVQEVFKLPWLIKEVSETVVGYAYATQWKPRKAYENTIEISVYVQKDTRGRGFGSELYQCLIDVLKVDGFHAVIGGISLPNDASVRLHESFGFKKVAHFKETGYKFDRWIDVGYWELIIS